MTTEKSTSRSKKYEGLAETRELLDEAGMRTVLSRMADGILATGLESSLVLVGIRTGGVYVAERLGALIAARVGHAVPLGMMDITLYRDDVFGGLAKPVIGSTELPTSIEGRTVVLVDDVLFTGRTTRAALAELIDFGRPEAVRLAVLVDRGHRELPIQADFVGIEVPTTRAELVNVMFREIDGVDRVVLRQRGAR